MMRFLAFILLFAAAVAVAFHQSGCADDTCRLEILSAEDGDPIKIDVCASCNRGDDPEAERDVHVELIPNGTPDIGCRCVAQTCVFCRDACVDAVCLITTSTNEPDGCTPQGIVLELDPDDFEDGFRLPVTIEATAGIGTATEVVFLERATPTPTPTATPTPSPTPTPTSSILPPLPIPTLPIPIPLP